MKKVIIITHQNGVQTCIENIHENYELRISILDGRAAYPLSILTKTGTVFIGVEMLNTSLVEERVLSV